MKAALLSARNDVLANVAIIVASLVTTLRNAVWPDVAAGLAIACFNLDAAKLIWTAAHNERIRAKFEPPAGESNGK